MANIRVTNIEDLRDEARIMWDKITEMRRAARDNNDISAMNELLQAEDSIQNVYVTLNMMFSDNA